MAGFASPGGPNLANAALHPTAPWGPKCDAVSHTNVGGAKKIELDSRVALNNAAGHYIHPNNGLLTPVDTIGTESAN